MVRLASLIAAIAVLVAGCGEPEDMDVVADQADLVVTVRPEGPGGPVETRRIGCGRLGQGAPSSDCRRLGSVTLQQLEPVPPETACTQIYGGPATARVRGKLRGERVDARFERTNGCEIQRWERNRALLGAAPKRG